MLLKDLTKVSKRGTKYEVYTISRRFLENLRIKILSKNIEYKTNKEMYHSRDNALCCGLLLSGLRASEIPLLKKYQIEDNKLLKVRTIKGGDLRKKIPLPTQRELGEWTRIFYYWLEKIPYKTAFVYPRGCGFSIDFDHYISRVRVYQIVREKTGYYPHFFRSVHASIYARVFGFDAWKLKSFMGWKNLNSSSPYVKSNWEQDENKINEVF